MKKILFIIIPVIILAVFLFSPFGKGATRTSPFGKWGLRGIFSFFLPPSEKAPFFLPPSEKGDRGGFNNNSAQAAAPKTGLVGWWTMDANDINGINYYDKSGQGNHATSTGSPSLVTGKIGQAIGLNGSSQYLIGPNSNSLSLPIFTVAAWVYPTGAFDYQMIITKVVGIGVSGNYQLRLETSTNKVLFAGNTALTSNSAVAYNQWTHVLATYDGTNARVYLNGVLNAGPTAISVTLNNNSVYIGERNDISGFSFGGRLDDVRIYNYALSAAEVAQLYSSAKTSYTQAPQRATSTLGSGGRLVGWWTMDVNDINGTNYYDKSGNNNTATSTGSPTVTAGKINQAGNFSNSYVGIPDQSYLRGTQQTFSMWVKPTATPAVFGGVLAHANSQEGYNFLFNASNQVVFYRRTVASAWVTAASAALPLNQWTHITGTVNGNTIQIFTNGVAGNSDSTASATLFVNSDYRIGDYMSTYNFSGSIDDVRIYNYALSAQEVANLYNASKQSYVNATVRRTGLTLDLNFGNNNGNAAPTVFDTSGNNRHATSTAGATSPTCSGKFCDFDGGDYMTANATNVFNSSNISIAIKFTPDFAASEVGPNRVFIDTSSGNRYLFYHAANSTLKTMFNGTSLTDISLITYQQYWKRNAENILIYSGTSGNNNFWLNGYKIMSAEATVWTSGDPTQISVGADVTHASLFDGKLHYLKVWNRLLTDDEVQIISADRNTYVR